MIIGPCPLRTGEGSTSWGRRKLVCVRPGGPAMATAPAGPERHWRKRRGPPAGDGLGNRGAIRARLSLHGSWTRRDPGR